jgi:hypothetical protein
MDLVLNMTLRALLMATECFRLLFCHHVYKKHEVNPLLKTLVVAAGSVTMTLRPPLVPEWLSVLLDSPHGHGITEELCMSYRTYCAFTHM